MWRLLIGAAIGCVLVLTIAGIFAMACLRDALLEDERQEQHHGDA